MRINENIGGVAGVSITPRDAGKANRAAPETDGDSVTLGFAAQYEEALNTPSAVEKALAVAVRQGSYDPQPQEIASALVGKAFAQ
jgi:hypothetical protein